MQSTQQSIDETLPSVETPMFYLPRLTDEQLSMLSDEAVYCFCKGPTRAHRLASYLARIAKLEAERRFIEDEGGEVLEVSMTPLRCSTWSNADVAAALLKLHVLRDNTEGELHELVERLHFIVFADAIARLDPHGEISIAAST